MPTGKHLAWMAAVALATVLAFESYKAKKSPSTPATTMWGRVA